MLRAVTDDDVREVTLQLIGAAKGGDVQAMRLFFAYVIGKPPEDAEAGEGIVVVFKRPALDRNVAGDSLEGDGAG